MGHQMIQRGPVEPFPRRRTRQAFHHAHLVALGLQPANEPGAGVGQPAVIQIHRVLRGQHNAQPESAGLLQQRQHRRLGRRIGRGRKIPEDLVHVEQRAQGRRACLATGPRQHLVEQHRHEKHPLRLRQVGDRKDRHPRLAFGRVEQALDVQRLALRPGRKSRRRRQIVEPHRQRKPVLRGKERFQRQHADLVDSRLLHGMDQCDEIEVPPRPPFAVHHHRQQDVLARLQGIRLHPRQRQQPRHRRRNPIPHRRGVVGKTGRRRIQRGQDRKRQPGPGSWRIDRKISRGLQAGDPRTVLPPSRQPFRPGLRRLRRVILRRHLFAGGLAFIHPWTEIRRGQPRKRQQQVAQVALGINHQDGNPVDGRLLDQADAQARLARACHSHAHRVGGQVLCVVQQGLGLRLRLARLVLAPQIEHAEFLNVHHDPAPSASAVIVQNPPTGFPAQLHPARRLAAPPGPPPDPRPPPVTSAKAHRR